MAANAQDKHNGRLQIPVWVKYALSVEEASAYYGIGIKSIWFKSMTGILFVCWGKICR